MSNKTFRYEHIYSSVKDKAPSASTLYTGEIAVNGNAEKPQLFIKDSSGDVRSFYTDYVVECTQAQYDAMEQAGTLDPRMIYVITDADPISLEIDTNIDQYSTNYKAAGAAAVYSKLGGMTLVKISQTDYDNLPTPRDPNTLFIISD